jgi:1,4-dihydroxy-2-naphthoate octaprenyltransferase
MAGDFNVALEGEGTNSGINNTLLIELLHDIIAKNHLVDTAAKTNNNKHTLYHRVSSGQSSRIYNILWGLLDLLYFLSNILGSHAQPTTPTV